VGPYRQVNSGEAKLRQSDLSIAITGHSFSLLLCVGRKLHALRELYPFGKGQQYQHHRRSRKHGNGELDLIVVLAGAAAIASHATTNTQINC